MDEIKKITKLSDFIEFLDSVKDAIHTWGITRIDFYHELDEKQKEEIIEIGEKYDLPFEEVEVVEDVEDEDFESCLINDEMIGFLMDRLVYSEREYHMDRLTRFLKDLDKFNVKSLATGITFLFYKSDLLENMNDLIEFLSKNAAKTAEDVGVSLGGISWISLNCELGARWRLDLKKIAEKYDLTDEIGFEIGSNNIDFTMDTLTYLGKIGGIEIYDMSLLIRFLKDIARKFNPVEFNIPGFTFKFEKIGE
ncbi:MAG: hypothetical protein QMD22_00045 [archaeon]|nr:hypothetical protein [archaeon]